MPSQSPSDETRQHRCRQLPFIHLVGQSSSAPSELKPPIPSRSYHPILSTCSSTMVASQNVIVLPLPLIPSEHCLLRCDGLGKYPVRARIFK